MAPPFPDHRALTSGLRVRKVIDTPEGAPHAELFRLEYSPQAVVTDDYTATIEESNNAKVMAVAKDALIRMAGASTTFDYNLADLLYRNTLAPSLRSAMKVQFDDDRLFVGCGSIDLFKTILNYLAPSGRVVASGPVWPLFADLLVARFGKDNVTQVYSDPDKPFVVNRLLDEMQRRGAASLALVHVETPMNATGAAFALEDIRAIADGAKQLGAFVLVDEAYANYIPSSSSALTLLPSYSNLIVLRSICKALGLGGIRVGYAFVADKDAAAALSQRGTPATPSRADVGVAVEVLEQYDALRDDVANRIIACRRALVDGVTAMGFDCVVGHPSVSVLMMRRPGIDRLADRFLQVGVGVKSAEDYKGWCTAEYARMRVPLDQSRVDRFLVKAKQIAPS